MVTLSRRRALQAGVTSTGALAIWPAAVLLGSPPPAAPRSRAGTTLESTIRPAGGPGYRRLGAGPGEQVVVRFELAEPRRGREDRREAAGVLVQVSDLHLTDPQNPMRFEYVDRLARNSHRPQELLGCQGTVALVRRINGLERGPWTGRRVDAVVSTGDNTDNQSLNELEWLLGVLAGGLVQPNSGAPDGFEGVAASGLAEYWQPGSPQPDDYKRRGFPMVPGLVEAATRPFVSPGLEVPWLLTMGNHDTVSNGSLGNRRAYEDWALGDRKVFSARNDAAYQLAAVLARPAAGDDVTDLLAQIARRGSTRSVQSDPARRPFTGEDYVRLLHQVRFTGAGPVGHGYAPDAGADRLFWSYDVTDRVTVISLDTTNQAGGARGSVGAAQLAWLAATLAGLADRYVVVLSHHPSHDLDNLAPDPRAPREQRYGADALLKVLHGHPQVVAWVNGHTHRNEITPHRHADPRRSFWEINSASHVDAPQQARVVELARNRDGTVSLFTTMLDADSPTTVPYDDLSLDGLGSLYREIAFNDPTYKERSGRGRDRNTELLLADPLG